MNILIINGPNLNLLGQRQPEVYGHTTLAQIAQMCQSHADKLGVSIDFCQNNHEGVLIDWIQNARGRFEGIIINAGAYTHSSIAIHDALVSVEIPTIELHLSDIKAREPFRHISYIEPIAFAHILGHGPKGYVMALDQMYEYLNSAA